MAIRCCIVGAGVNGLTAARYLSEVMEVVVFECKDEIGGQWYTNYLTDTETPETDLFKQVYGHQQSSVYEGMQTLEHSEQMSYPEFRRVYSCGFPQPQEVLQYLLDYVEKFNLRPFIQFRTAVTDITPLSQNEFEVTTRDTTGEETKQIFNRVVVANGHSSVPYIPNISGVETFPGKVQHSHNIKKRPQRADYEGKKVVIVGAFPSAWDLIRILVRLDGQQVIVSATKFGLSLLGRITDPIFASLRESGKIVLTSTIARIEGSTLHFTEGDPLEADEVIFCTGYCMSFPFLKHQVLLEEGRFPANLYRGMIDLKYPRIAHIGLFKGSVFIVSQTDAMYLKRIFLEEPDIEAMQEHYRQWEEKQRALGLNLRSLFGTKYVFPDSIAKTFQEYGFELDPDWFQFVTAAANRFFNSIYEKFMTYREQEVWLADYFDLNVTCYSFSKANGARRDLKGLGTRMGLAALGSWGRK
eukprot:CAMPEP_0204913128 /NCGR_PEP_ID=MMETSP1397-20131031/11127_1 /ASSEMBLY_ACC=CAM_ASM_000891 /TAXON_ID=49980 /ORGANISM="Climacostomum Climacostomum virens, Strain Stock W-24" /LENGTH=468 /DNA_ID=CAMNT_0052084317 /DNA_START=38 /DNA_END=1445 /DNA_ORIENTATION=-